MNTLHENNKHITTETIIKDIYDTKKEIFQMQREIKGFELLGDKMSLFRASARKNGIKERVVFLEALDKMLSLRQED